MGSLTLRKDGIVPKQVIKSPTGTYEILKRIGETACFNLYLCKSGEITFILKIAATVEHNALLDREAFVLQEMRSEAARLEDEYARIKDNPEEVLNYHFCFPDIVETFIAPNQGSRRVNILGFSAVDDLGSLVPIRHLMSRDHVRVDRKTSAWMMGKFLKILVFAHSQNISVGRISGDNILIGRDDHYVALFDWTLSTMYTKRISTDVVCKEIAQGAREVILALGGDLKDGTFFDDEADPDNRYAAYLYALASGEENSAQRAHERFYLLVRSLWPRSYWPFTAYNM